MLKQFCLDIKLHKSDFLMPLCVVPACFLLGFGFCSLIMFVIDDPGTWVTFGTFMAFFSLIFCAVLTFGRYYQQFMLALSMGRTRASFLFSYALRTLLWLAAGYALLLILYRVELAVGSKLFAPWPLEADPTFLTDWSFVAAALPCVTVFSMFVGALYSYFGKKAMAPLWFLWMALCLLGPQMDSGKLAPVARILEAVPGWGWVVLGLAVLAGMAGTVIGLGKKQMVK